VRIARDQIAESGAHAMSLASVARLAGVSQPAPYRHFADRDALLEAVTTEGFEEFTAALTAAAAAGGRDGALKAMALAYVAFGEANIELYRLMFASRLVPEAGVGSALGTAAVEAFNRLARSLVRHDPGGPRRGRSPSDLGPIAWAGNAEGRRTHQASLGGIDRSVDAYRRDTRLSRRCSYTGPDKLRLSSLAPDFRIRTILSGNREGTEGVAPGARAAAVSSRR